MSIDHQTVITCDQQPLPTRCTEKILIKAGQVYLSAEVEKSIIAKALIKNDWGVVNVHGKDAHYCPYHRPVR